MSRDKIFWFASTIFFVILVASREGTALGRIAIAAFSSITCTCLPALIRRAWWWSETYAAAQRSPREGYRKPPKPTARNSFISAMAIASTSLAIALLQRPASIESSRSIAPPNATPATSTGSPSSTPAQPPGQAGVPDTPLPAWVPRAFAGTPPLPPVGDFEAREALVSWAKRYAQEMRFGARNGKMTNGSSMIGTVSALAETHPRKKSRSYKMLTTALDNLKSASSATKSNRFATADESYGRATAALASVIEDLDHDLSLTTGSGLPFGEDPNITYERATVVRWIDGDSVMTSRGEVRLIGVNAPEMSKNCDAAEAARRYAQSAAPVGSTVNLGNPLAVKDYDRHKRRLRYLITISNKNSKDLVPAHRRTDLGYSLLRSGNAIAQYDSRDGFQWHPAEKSYRSIATTRPTEAKCSYKEPQFLDHVRDDSDDDGLRRSLLKTVSATHATTRYFRDWVSAARREYERENSYQSPDSSGDDYDYNSDRGDSGGESWFCRRKRWC